MTLVSTGPLPAVDDKEQHKRRIRGWSAQDWWTDFGKVANDVALDESASGGPLRNGIPPLDVERRGQWFKSPNDGLAVQDGASAARILSAPNR